MEAINSILQLLVSVLLIFYVFRYIRITEDYTFLQEKYNYIESILKKQLIKKRLWEIMISELIKELESKEQIIRKYKLEKFINNLQKKQK